MSCAREVWDRSGTPLLSKEAHIAYDMAITISVPTSDFCIPVPKQAFGAKLEFWTQMDIIVGPLCTAAWASPGLLGYLHGDSETHDASFKGYGIGEENHKLMMLFVAQTDRQSCT